MAESSSPGAAGLRDPNCPFCAIVAADAPAERILETEHLVAFLDVRPLFRGHTLLVPKAHLRLLSDLPAELAAGSMILVNNVVSQSVPHLHLHVIPRNPKDGLRFWLGPRQRYDAEHPAEEYAAKIRAALPG
jgi:histidine triad (HIT) family protein